MRLLWWSTFIPLKAAGGKRLLSYAVNFTEVVFAKITVSLWIFKMSEDQIADDQSDSWKNSILSITT